MYLNVPLSLKSLDETGRFAGYASVFGVIDSQNDTILRGAFENTLRTNAGQIKLLWQHMFAEPIGTVTHLFEDAKGLYMEGRLLFGVARAREVFALLKSGAVNGMSIGYTPKTYHYDAKGVRVLEQVDLWEVSLVTFPANGSARVTVVKSATPPAQDFAWQKAKDTGQLIALTDAVDKARRTLN